MSGTPQYSRFTIRDAYEMTIEDTFSALEEELRLLRDESQQAPIARMIAIRDSLRAALTALDAPAKAPRPISTATVLIAEATEEIAKAPTEDERPSPMDQDLAPARLAYSLPTRPKSDSSYVATIKTATGNWRDFRVPKSVAVAPNYKAAESGSPAMRRSWPRGRSPAI